MSSDPAAIRTGKSTMYRSMKAELTSVAPLIINNRRLANPLDPWTKMIKQITSKKLKTDADHEEKGRLEWYGSLYLDSEKHVCLPDFLVEATLIAAAKKTKQGPQAKSGMIITGDFPLVYDGPSDIDELWNDGRFTFTVMAKPPGQGVVPRTRPKFDEWSITIEVQYDDEQLNASDIQRFVNTAGSLIGFGNWRPRYGRFNAQFL